MSKQQPSYGGPPSDKDTPSQDRGLFHQEAQKHECHHYLRMYGGQVATAAMYGFGATLGADAANAAVGEMRVSFKNGGGIDGAVSKLRSGSMMEILPKNV
nr:hypothetical protein B0A51_11157 [Rachicladosporium sp. CCFEE 5018]